jgi:hypothetical protein
MFYQCKGSQSIPQGKWIVGILVRRMIMHFVKRVLVKFLSLSVEIQEGSGSGCSIDCCNVEVEAKGGGHNIELWMDISKT